jgi:hypothetical protein
MADSFDPYLRWLGIRDPQRPPNHYRLLGVDLFESDSDVIAVAADRQMAHVRTFQTGQLAELSQQLLNELAAARICLLKPEKKAAYDAQLKKQLGGVAVAGRPKPQPSAADGLPVAARIVAATGDEMPAGGSRVAVAEEFPDFASLASASNPNDRAAASATNRSNSKTSAFAARRKKSLAPWIGLAVAGILLVIGVIVVQSMNEPAHVAEADGPDGASPTTNVPIGSSKSGAPNSTQTLSQAGRKPAAESKASPNHNDPGSSLAASSYSHSPEPGVATPRGNDPTIPQGGSAEPAFSKKLPQEPPVHPARDVIRVEDPEQSSSANPGGVANAPTQVADARDVKPDVDGANKSDGYEMEQHPAPKNPKLPLPQGSDSKPKRAPVPSNEQIVAAEAKVQKLFNVSAAKKPDERAALAQTLYDEGVDSNNRAADRYVLLRMAMKDAAALGDADLALRAAGRFGEVFDVNALAEKIGVLTMLGKTVRAPTAAQFALGTAQDLLDSALVNDDFEAAKELAQSAATIAAKSGDAAVTRQMRQRLAEIDQIKKEYIKAESARDTLQSKPDDPEANQIWGYYVGPIKGDFDRGLPCLAKGSEKSSANLARDDLAQPTDPKAQAALADGWLEFSNNEREPARVHLRSHAAQLYSQAVGKLTGLEKKRVEDQLARLGPPTKTSIIGGKNFIKFLTDGSWTITWLPNANATDPYATKGWIYTNMVFNPNGTCSNIYDSGTWSQDSPSSVLVRYTRRPTYLQRYILGSKGQLECEYYNPPGTFQNHGVGTKDGTKRN